MVNIVPWNLPRHSIHHDTPLLNNVSLFVSPEEIFHDLRGHPKGSPENIPIPSRRYCNNFFFNRDFLKRFSYKTCKFYWSWLREVIKTTKFRVVAVTHGNDSQLFSCCQKKLRVVAVTHGDDLKKNCRQKECDKKMLRVVAVNHGDNLTKFLLPDYQKHIKGLSPWVPATTLNYVVLIASLQIDSIHKNCMFSSKNHKKTLHYKKNKL